LWRTRRVHFHVVHEPAQPDCAYLSNRDDNSFFARSSRLDSGPKSLDRRSPIQALYAHNIELLPRQGAYIDQADVAFSFSSPIHIYGIHQESPSALHHLDCAGFSANSKATVQLPDPTREISSVLCMIRPIHFQGGRHTSISRNDCDGQK
jgi:hypothetical protein